MAIYDTRRFDREIERRWISITLTDACKVCGIHVGMMLRVALVGKSWEFHRAKSWISSENIRL
jgi:hypothetical protein